MENCWTADYWFQNKEYDLGLKSCRSFAQLICSRDSLVDVAGSNTSVYFSCLHKHPDPMMLHFVSCDRYNSGSSFLRQNVLKKHINLLMYSSCARGSEFRPSQSQGLSLAQVITSLSSSFLWPHQTLEACGMKIFHHIDRYLAHSKKISGIC